MKNTTVYMVALALSFTSMNTVRGENDPAVAMDTELSLLDQTSGVAQAATGSDVPLAPFNSYRYSSPTYGWNTGWNPGYNTGWNPGYNTGWNPGYNNSYANSYYSYPTSYAGNYPYNWNYSYNDPWNRQYSGASYNPWGNSYSYNYNSNYAYNWGYPSQYNTSVVNNYYYNNPGYYNPGYYYPTSGAYIHGLTIGDGISHIISGSRRDNGTEIAGGVLSTVGSILTLGSGHRYY